MTGQPFTLLVDITLKPGRADEFMALLNDVFEAMKVEETFVSASALRGAEDPNTILLYENWIDRENFMSVQLKRPYRDRYEARLPELLRSPPQIVLLRADSVRAITLVAKGGLLHLRLVTGSLSAVSEAPMSEELGVETLYRALQIRRLEGSRPGGLWDLYLDEPVLILCEYAIAVRALGFQ